MTRTISRRVLREVRDLTIGDSTVILNAVQRHVLKKASEPDLERRSDVLHPSEMAKAEWCWRESFYELSHVPISDKPRNPSFTMENIFEEGSTIHRKWQGWLREIGVLYGLWHCRDCQFHWYDTSPSHCAYCESPRIRYGEVPLLAKDLGIGGHADGGLVTDTFRLLEIKSVSIGTLRFEAPDLYQRYLDGDSLDKIWMEIKRPFPAHLRQGIMYLYLSARFRELEYPDMTFVDPPGAAEIVFIYEWKPTQKVKEFVVKYNPRMIERMIAGAQWVWEGMEVGRPPKRPKWAQNEDGPICRSCPFRSTCWHLAVESEPDGNQGHQETPVILRKSRPAQRRKALGRV